MVAFLALTAGLAAARDPWAEIKLDINSRGGVLISANMPDGLRPSDLAQQVSKALGCRIESVYQSPRQWFADCSGLLRAEGLEVSGWLNLGPLHSAVSRMGFPLISLVMHVPSVGLEPDVDEPWQVYNYRGDYYHTYFSYSWESLPPPPIHLKFGYSEARMLPVLNTLVLGLVLPLLFTMTLRIRAKKRMRAGDPYAAFGFASWFPWILNGAWLFWAISLGASGVLEFVLYVDSASAVRTALWSTVSMAGVPLFAILTCSILAHPVFAKMPGFGTGAVRLAAKATGQFAAFVVPFALVIAGVNALFTQPRVLFGCWLGAFLTRKALVAVNQMANSTTAYQILKGELYDQCRTLAGRARVQLRALYVLPSGADRQINAFASSNKTIAISQELLEHSSKREVDAVVAHELGHLSSWGIRPNIASLVGCILFGDCYNYMLGHMGLAGTWMSYVPAGPALAILLAMWLSRQAEHKADAKSVAIAADPEALITFLAKTARLTQIPMEFSAAQGNLATHPSVMRRARAIAKIGSVPEERILELIAADGLVPEDQRYQVQLSAATDNKVFSAKYQMFAAKRWGVLMRASFLVLGLLVAHGVGVYVFDFQGTARIGILGAIAALPLCFAVLVAVNGSLWRCDARGLKRRLEAELGVKSDLFVGLAPDPQPRSYTLRDEWDVGLLKLTREGLCYLGSADRFLVPAANIRSVEIGPGLPAWWRTDRVWVRLADGTAFSLAIYSPLEWSRAAEARALRVRLEEWRANPAAASETAPAGLSSPHLTPGRGSWIAAGQVLRSWLRDSVFYVLTGLSMSVIIGEPFGWLAGLMASALDLLTELPWLWSRDPLAGTGVGEEAVMEGQGQV